MVSKIIDVYAFTSTDGDGGGGNGSINSCIGVEVDVERRRAICPEYQKLWNILSSQYIKVCMYADYNFTAQSWVSAQKD